MFGCGQYPAYDTFVQSVKEEAIQNVKRLRHHPSIVIFGQLQFSIANISVAQNLRSWK